MIKQYCEYYQARVKRETTWFVVGCFRNEDHIAFERTLDKQSEILEFFVPKGQEFFFLDLMSYMKRKGYVLQLEKHANRMEQEATG